MLPSVWPLSCNLSDKFEPTRDQCPHRYSLQGPRDTQASPPRQGNSTREGTHKDKTKPNDKKTSTHHIHTVPVDLPVSMDPVFTVPGLLSFPTVDADFNNPCVSSSWGFHTSSGFASLHGHSHTSIYHIHSQTYSIHTLASTTFTHKHTPFTH